MNIIISNCFVKTIKLQKFTTNMYLHGQADRRTEGQMDRWTDRQMYLHGQADRWTDGQTDGQINRQMETLTNRHACRKRDR